MSQQHNDMSIYQGVRAPKEMQLPEKDHDEVRQRPDIPPPHPWAKTVVVEHFRTGATAVVWTVDLMTRQFRLWYPDRSALPLPDQFDGKTDWQNMDATDWRPKLEFTATELRRQQAVTELEGELAMYTTPEEMDLVTVLIDTDDPVKALAKLRVLRSAGFIRKPDAPAQSASTTPEKKAGK